MFKVSVIVCSHNPRQDYLERTLNALKTQTLDKEDWELLLIDNASDSALSEAFDLSWHPRGRHVCEQKLGLTQARLRGVQEANGSLLVFVDDDNELASDYLSNSIQLGKAHPFLGTFGAGAIEPEFEIEPESSLKDYTWMLALRNVRKPCWANHPSRAPVPWGAGLVVTAAVARAYLEDVYNHELKRDLDRSGDTLNAGGDDEFSWIAASLGLGCGVFPSLRLIHLIPARRVEKSYLLKICEGHAYSHTILDHVHGASIKEKGPVPKFSQAWAKALRGQISGFLASFQAAWHWRRISETSRAFLEAEIRGHQNALALLSQKSGNSESRESGNQ